MKLRGITKALLLAALLFGFILLLVALVGSHTMDVLMPKGEIAQQELNLLIFAAALSLLVAIPVFILTALIVMRYRETEGSKAQYSPNLDGNRAAELTWWAIPILLIGVLAVVTWTSTHKLEPSKPLASTTPPLTVQVVALDWKWLFIYPEQGVASVNQLTIPTDRPVSFEITSDAPMNSFWIPQLSGQIYAMPGMSTRLNLNATAAGIYRGSSANLSGAGYAGMTFDTSAVSPDQFDAWVKAAQQSPLALNTFSYRQLAQPSSNVAPAVYSLKTLNLYDRVIGTYMAPAMESASE